MSTSQPGKEFFANHMQHLQTGDMEVIKSDYADDVVVYNNFDINYLGEPAPNIIHGSDNFIDFFKALFVFQGNILSYNINAFSETEDSILFSSSSSFSNTGDWLTANVLIMNSDFSKIKRQFMYAHKL